MNSSADPGARVTLHRLSKRYVRRDVLRRASLEIEPGEFVAIVGRSGCGKSTLLRLVAGLEDPTRGSVRIDGDAQGGLREDTRIMFQDARLLPWRRVWDNVALGLASERHDQALDLLGQVGLADRAGEWPSRLSGGQRQRVALARALAHEPRLLLLDEPLGALDALTRIEMQRLIESLWRRHGFTALLVTHDVQEAVSLADRVVLIEEGQVTMDLRIPLPRPRSHGDAAFAALEQQILARVLETTEADPPDAHRFQPAAHALRWAV
ncbi:MAG TPA: ATP-binding cassette domain-containing protein [Ramlibacter sp.]|uniref:ATP-binding cassette domain-containing protein n=1 Tax=Ramlibacter sp. TaxID=1917967 RepID=UPI002BBC6648|nr:ATP-binding cassette domain-containing protein [Ramlibacter sp.]HVZ44687.1 ATP-binding cassette domain-containing protein [Ramlibacter sp.]